MRYHSLDVDNLALQPERSLRTVLDQIFLSKLTLTLELINHCSFTRLYQGTPLTCQRAYNVEKLSDAVVAADSKRLPKRRKGVPAEQII